MINKILIVDDTETDRSTMEWLLINAGYQVATHTDAETTVEAVRRFQPNLIIMDLNLPVVNGIKLCKQIRTDAQAPDMPIIVLGSPYAKDSIFEAVEVGATDVIIKPIDHAVLIEIVKEHLKGKS